MILKTNSISFLLFAIFLLAFSYIAPGSYTHLDVYKRQLRHAMENARLNHATKLFLEVRPSNERAVELYRHFGFRQIGQRKGYYPAALGREDALIFDKELV